MAMVVIGLIPMRLLSPKYHGNDSSVDPMVPGSLPMGKSTVHHPMGWPYGG